MSESAAPPPGGEPGRFAPCGIVTLTTDFGLHDPFVGAMKGRILARCPTARIVDLTHGITPFRPAEAGFWLARLRHDFPAGTVHVAVVDPGVGTSRRLLGVELEGQVLLAPDNGLAGPLAGRPGARVRAWGEPLLAALCAEPSATFHGRDLFAPLAAELAAGRLSFDDIGSECADWVAPVAAGPARTTGEIRGEVLLADRFGNIFSNIELEFDVLRKARAVRFAGHRLPVARTYGERPAGSCVALVNAFGVVEAACVGGSAADALGLRAGDPVVVEL